MSDKYIPMNFTHVDGDTIIQLHQNVFDPEQFRVTLGTTLDGDIRREDFNNCRAAIRCYLGMIADECDCYAPNQISNMVNR